jgi:hypothetical protein
MGSNLLMRLLFKIKGNPTFGYYKFFKKKEYSSLEKNLKYQEDRLKEIILYSWYFKFFSNEEYSFFLKNL